MQQRLHRGHILRGIGNSLEGLADDVVLGDPGAEQLAGDGGDRLVAVGLAAGTRHRGRRADADHRIRLQTLAQPTHEQGDICALPSAIGMELIQHQELQTTTMFDHAPVDFLITRKDELQHHEVGQQDVWRVCCNKRTLGLTFLAGVASDRERLLIRGIADQELVELFQLAVGERVHRIDHDGPGPRAAVLRPPLDDPVDHGNEEGQGLAGASTRGDNVALPLDRLGQRLQLVSVQVQRLRRGFLVDLEDIAACLVQHPIESQLLHGTLALVVRIYLD